uniref:F-box domain-containing protein n=1 Tax=Mycena chlorophos TaxID=658473 RepID=A0ABQ0M248_MYCCL|nr:predicted protein [Mycena chlorophos]
MLRRLLSGTKSSLGLSPKLPVELTLRIIDHLGADDDDWARSQATLLVCGLVCPFANYDCGQRVSEDDTELLGDALRRVTNVKRLVVVGPGWRLSDYSLDFAFKLKHSVKLLVMDQRALRPNGFARFVAMFPHLQRVHLADPAEQPFMPVDEETWNVVETTQHHLTLPALQSLFVHSPFTIPFIQWLSASPLTRLELYLPPTVREAYKQALPFIFTGNLSWSLERLIIGLPALPDSRIALPDLSRCIALKVLIIRGILVDYIDPMLVASTLGAPRIRRVMFEFRNVSQAGWPTFSDSLDARWGEVSKMDAGLADRKTFGALGKVCFLMSTKKAELDYGPFPCRWGATVRGAFPRLHARGLLAFEYR